MRAVRELAERAYFALCLAIGRLLRSARYSRTRIVRRDGALEVRKRRLLHAPLLVRMGEPLMRILGTGVRILPQRDWEEWERRLHRALHRPPVRLDAGGVLVLPHLAGETLAALLERAAPEDPSRASAMELAAAALAAFHARGVTHGDAMADNVLVDLHAGAAHWFDFETVHDPSRPLAWRRADDVRALLATCLVRTAPESRAEALRLILDVYADEQVTRALSPSFDSVLRRPLAFHLGQAGLSLQCYREIGRLLSERVGR